VINIIATPGYRFRNAAGLDIGYRYLAIDFKEGDFLYGVSLYGIVTGLGIHF
jgi:hypothetical protein